LSENASLSTTNHKVVRCCGLFSHRLNTNLLLNVLVKKIKIRERSAIFRIFSTMGVDWHKKSRGDPSPLVSHAISLEVGSLNPARGLREHCKLPQRGLGRSPSGNKIWFILALKLTSSGNNNFWATVCKMVHPMLSDRCLTATLVYCCQKAGWIKMKLGV